MARGSAQRVVETAKKHPPVQPPAPKPKLVESKESKSEKSGPAKKGVDLELPKRIALERIEFYRPVKFRGRGHKEYIDTKVSDRLGKHSLLFFPGAGVVLCQYEEGGKRWRILVSLSNVASMDLATPADAR